MRHQARLVRKVDKGVLRPADDHVIRQRAQWPLAVIARPHMYVGAGRDCHPCREQATMTHDPKHFARKGPPDEAKSQYPAQSTKGLVSMCNATPPPAMSSCSPEGGAHELA